MCLTGSTQCFVANAAHVCRYGVVTSGTDINDATINPAGTDMIVAQDDGTLACAYIMNHNLRDH